MPETDKSKILTKVHFEFADGHSESLEGVDAQDWNEAVTVALVLQRVRGYGIPLAGLKWINSSAKAP